MLTCPGCFEPIEWNYRPHVVCPCCGRAFTVRLEPSNIQGNTQNIDLLEERPGVAH